MLLVLLLRQAGPEKKRESTEGSGQTKRARDNKVLQGPGPEERRGRVNKPNRQEKQ